MTSPVSVPAWGGGGGWFGNAILTSWAADSKLKLIWVLEATKSVWGPGRTVNVGKGKGVSGGGQEALGVAEMASYTVFSLLRSSVSFYFKKVLRSFFLFGYSVGHAGSWFPDQGSNPHPLPCKGGVLTTGPRGKSLVFHFKFLMLWLLKPHQVNSFSTWRHWLRVFEWFQERI